MALALCVSCLESGAGELHYSHNAHGQAQALNATPEGGFTEPEVRMDAPFRTGTVRLAPTPARWQRQEWGASNGRQNLYRVGGPPSWVQSDWVPDCLGCGQAMRFVLQLDSDLPLADSLGAHLWGSGGMCYGFACGHCRNTAFLLQHT